MSGLSYASEVPKFPWDNSTLSNSTFNSDYKGRKSTNYPSRNTQAGYKSNEMNIRPTQGPTVSPLTTRSGANLRSIQSYPEYPAELSKWVVRCELKMNEFEPTLEEESRVRRAVISRAHQAMADDFASDWDWKVEPFPWQLQQLIQKHQARSMTKPAKKKRRRNEYDEDNEDDYSDQESENHQFRSLSPIPFNGAARPRQRGRHKKTFHADHDDLSGVLGRTKMFDYGGPPARKKKKWSLTDKKRKSKGMFESSHGSGSSSSSSGGRSSNGSHSSFPPARFGSGLRYDVGKLDTFSEGRSVGRKRQLSESQPTPVPRFFEDSSEDERHSQRWISKKKRERRSLVDSGGASSLLLFDHDAHVDLDDSRHYIQQSGEHSETKVGSADYSSMDGSRGREFVTRSGVRTSVSVKKKKGKKKKGKGKWDEDMAGSLLSSEDKLRERRRRFQKHLSSKTPVSKSVHSSEMIDERGYSLDEGGGRDWMMQAIIGQCTELEKPYLRLTSAPLASEVRSPGTCRRTFAMLQDCWALRKRDYLYLGEQLKSLRQDLRVQHIRDEFTIAVYEFNSRVCLQVCDMSEFNQCLSQLWNLYTPSMFAEAAANDEEKEKEESICVAKRTRKSRFMDVDDEIEVVSHNGGRRLHSSSVKKNVLEFVCLRILYCAVTKSQKGFYECMKRIRSNMKKKGMNVPLHSDVQRAMDVFKCVMCNRFELFFEHYNWYVSCNESQGGSRLRSNPRRYEYLVLDQIVWRLRFDALKTSLVSLSGMKTIPMSWFVYRLGFLSRGRRKTKSDEYSSDVAMMMSDDGLMSAMDESDLLMGEELAKIECLDYLQKCRVMLDESKEHVLCKDSFKQMSSLVRFVPQSKDEEMGVTHGSMFSDAGADKDMSAGLAKFLRKN